MASSEPVQTSSFELLAGPATDLWRKPPSTDRANAVHRSLGKVPLGDFGSAGVTFRAEWQQLYDQAGIALFFKQSDGRDKWIKSGVEFYKGKPYVSVVATDAFSDWSITPVVADSRQSAPSSSQEVTIEVRREGDDMGPSIWLYQLLLDQDGKEIDRVPLRECSWVYAQDPDVQLEIAAYAARPSKGSGTGELLQIHFQNAWWARRK